MTKQYIKLFQLEKIELEFEYDALLEIAAQAVKRKTGARGLRSVIEKKLLSLQFELAELKESGIEKIRITKDVIDGSGKPILIKHIENSLLKTG